MATNSLRSTFSFVERGITVGDNVRDVGNGVFSTVVTWELGGSSDDAK